jgi:hypothetical protein
MTERFEATRRHERHVTQTYFEAAGAERDTVRLDGGA